MPRTITGEVEIVPGVVGPERIVDDRGVIPTPGGGVDIELDIRYDVSLQRYICHEFRAVRGPGVQPNSSGVTTEALRQVTAIEHWIVLALLVNGSDGSRVIRELENPGGVEPWGLAAPEDVAERGPTDRALQWVSHFYRYGFAVSFGATKAVEEGLRLPRSTAGRWVGLARLAGYLGPAAGPGKEGV